MFNEAEFHPPTPVGDRHILQVGHYYMLQHGTLNQHVYVQATIQCSDNAYFSVVHSMKWFTLLWVYTTVVQLPQSVVRFKFTAADTNKPQTPNKPRMFLLPRRVFLGEFASSWLPSLHSLSRKPSRLTIHVLFIVIAIRHKGIRSFVVRDENARGIASNVGSLSASLLQ